LFQILTFLVFALSICISYTTVHAFCGMFDETKLVAKNYKGDLVPQGVGIILPFFCLLGYSLFLLSSEMWPLNNIIVLFTFAIFAMSMVGFLDDVLGSRDVQGLLGHFKALAKGKITTGSLKAIVGLLVSFVISIYITHAIGSIVLNTLLMALYTNLLNLLDLRPGRCIKFYFLLIAILALFSYIRGDIFFLALFYPLLGTVLGYFPYDLNARCMMGDAGSNVLGISAGILAVMSLNTSQKLVNLVLLVLIHIFAEKYSISDLINNNNVLSWFDQLGRGKEID
jgi:UDP-GlcNAc:undecaprenyl-phosphate GlcNAc-1-phosphate transferase